MVVIGLNGFNRIARNFLRTVYDDISALQKVTVAVINIGPADPEYVAHTFKYDALLGTYPGNVKIEGNFLVINTHKIRLYAQADVTKIDWAGHEVTWVVETAGICKTQKDIKKFGASVRVLLAYPCGAAEVTYIAGSGGVEYEGQFSVSLGSCLDHAIQPLLKVVSDIAGSIIAGNVTVLYGHTNDHIFGHLRDCLDDTDTRSMQNNPLVAVQGSGVEVIEQEFGITQLQRSPALNIIPAGSYGMALPVQTVILEKQESTIKHGMQAIQISLFSMPLERVSLVDFTLIISKNINTQDLRSKLKHAFDIQKLAGLEYCENSFVSSDVIDNPHGLIVDGTSVKVVTQSSGERISTTIKIFGWYDNQSSYSAHIKNFLLKYGALTSSNLEVCQQLKK